MTKVTNFKRLLQGFAKLLRNISYPSSAKIAYL